ncbi:MAG: CBS domain-containing protein [Patescibacteria group bacterium]|nr:CBS domain-containing protein [Patescibacteria group bacterium]
MPYISQLLNNKITDSSDEVVGKLQDVLIEHKTGSFAPLEYLAVKTIAANPELVFVPYSLVENFSRDKISLKSLFSKITPAKLTESQFTFLKRDILDKQIVDVGGTRVVRVNDLRIGNFENHTCVLGIDASLRGLLRRLGLEALGAFLKRQVGLIDWRQAQLLESGPLQLNTASEDLGRLHPADLANIVEELDIQQGSKLLEALSEAEAAKVLEELEPNLQAVLIKYLGSEKAGKILARMSSDEIVDLIKTFSSREAQALLLGIGNGRAQSVAKLMHYDDDTAGGLMTTDFVRVDPEWTVSMTVEEIRSQSPKMRSILYVYAASADGAFAGVASMRRLLISPPETLIKKLIKKIPYRSTLRPNDPVRRILKIMTKYNLYAAAVLDREKKILGIVTVDDVLRRLYPSA